MRSPARTSLQIRNDPPPGPAEEPEEPSDQKRPSPAPDSVRMPPPSPKSREPQRMARPAGRSVTAQETAAPARTQVLQAVPPETRRSVSPSVRTESQAVQPGGRQGFPLQGWASQASEERYALQLFPGKAAQKQRPGWALEPFGFLKPESSK